jgi:hypothetical protein
MDRFFAGLVVGVLIERFHVIRPSPDALVMNGCLKPEVLMEDVMFIALVLGAFSLMAWAIRALQR